MHRSGTSACTRVINIAGVDLGSDFLKPAECNIKGFFEDNDAKDINDELLNARQSIWSTCSDLAFDQISDSERGVFEARIEAFLRKRFEETEIFGVKDPRMCRTLPVWQAVLKKMKIEPYYIIIYRNPLEVAASLNKRDGFTAKQSFNLWLLHNLDIEAYTCGQKRAIICYERLMESPVEAVEEIMDALDLKVDLNREKKDEIGRFLDHGMRHSVYTAEDLAKHNASCEVVALYAFLQKDLMEFDSGIFDSFRRKYRYIRRSKTNVFYLSIKLISFFVAGKESRRKLRSWARAGWGGDALQS